MGKAGVFIGSVILSSSVGAVAASPENRADFAVKGAGVGVVVGTFAAMAAESSPEKQRQDIQKNQKRAAPLSKAQQAQADRARNQQDRG